MTGPAIEIVPCPAELSAEALAIVLRELAPAQRAAIAPQLGDGQHASEQPIDGLRIACSDGRVIAAVWGQRQPGNTAILWPPQLLEAVDRAVADQLNRSAIDALDAAGIDMTQVLLPDREAAEAAALERVGFSHLADLLYLRWETTAVRDNPGSRLEFESYKETARERLCRLLEKTYEGTLDCAGLDGQRQIDDVVDGYRATGDFRPENWLFVCADGQDVGVLLLAEHRAARHYELVYMGLLPAARGQAWGLEITSHAQRLTAAASAERLVLAVDATNQPALVMYHDAGFVAWDRRSVYVRSRAS